MSAFKMFTFLTILIASCFSVNSNYVPLTGTILNDLGQKVTEELSKEILNGLKVADVSIKSIQPTIEGCLNTIETRQSACTACINQNCQDRLSNLQCNSVTVNTVSECTVSNPVCSIKKTVEKARNTILLIEQRVKFIVEKVINTVKTVVEQGVKKIEAGVNQVISEGAQQVENGVNTVKNLAEDVGKEAVQKFQEAAEGIKKAVETVKTVGEKAVQEIQSASKTIVNEAEKVAQTVGNKVEDIAKDAGSVIANGAKDAVNAVKDLFGSIGRRRRLAALPGCQAFSEDPNVCVFYQGLCQQCEVFGTNEAQASIFEVISGVCAPHLPVDYNNLADLLTKVDGMSNIVGNFVLEAVEFNPVSAVNGVYNDVKLQFNDNNQNYTISVSQPLVPFDIQTAGPAIAKDIFNKLFA